MKFSSFAAFIRLTSALILFATAALAVFPAPTHLLWMVAVGVTEWGHALALICLAVAVPVWSNSWSGKVAAGLCVAAAIVALTPLLRASRIARDLPRQLREAFGVATPTRSAPLVYTDLFRGILPQQMRAETFVYSKIRDTELSLDFYRAQIANGRSETAPTAAPLVIVIHGGSWQSGDNKDFIPMNRYLAGRGFAVADILYRLAPRWKFPSASDDVRSAIAFFRERADSLNIDPNRIVLLGRSAGGQIALNVAYSSNDPGIRGVISFYAPSDLFWSWEHPGNPLVIDTKGVLADYLGGSPAQAASNYGAGSPIRFVNSKTPPTLLLHGGRDELVSSYHSVRLMKVLADAGVPHLNVELPWATHGFDYILRGPGGQISLYAVEYFLARVVH